MMQDAPASAQGTQLASYSYQALQHSMECELHVRLCLNNMYNGMGCTLLTQAQKTLRCNASLHGSLLWKRIAQAAMAARLLHECESLCKGGTAAGLT